jgi:hypothetical protein
MLKVVWPCIKGFILLLLFMILKFGLEVSLLKSSAICIAVLIGYQDVIAFIVPNTIRMPAMDS